MSVKTCTRCGLPFCDFCDAGLDDNRICFDCEGASKDEEKARAAQMPAPESETDGR